MLLVCSVAVISFREANGASKLPEFKGSGPNDDLAGRHTRLARGSDRMLDRPPIGRPNAARGQQ
jgi:hypothetical protein